MDYGEENRNHSRRNHTVKRTWGGYDHFDLFASQLLPLYTYHVIIAQDGHDYFRLGKIGRQAEELMQNKEMERSIIIGVPYENVTERRNTYHPDGTKFEAYKRFLANELVLILMNTIQPIKLDQGVRLLVIHWVRRFPS